MSEPVAKERPPVDFDAFERRFTPQNDHQNYHRDDPLAELARLVGEHHDPYRDVFADEASLQDPVLPPPDGRREPAFGVPPAMSARLSGDFAAIEAGLRGTLPSHPETPAYAGSAEHEFYAQHAEYPQDEQAFLQDHEDQQWGAEPRQRQAAAPRSRRPLYAMAATIAVGVIGVGAAFAYKGSASSPREIRTIMAAAGPTKIQPPADASNDQAVQDAAILGKSGQQAAPTQTVSREEQPVDLSQAVQANGSRDADAGPGSQGDASSVPVPPSPSQADGSRDAMPTIDPLQGFGAGMPAPRKVKVVSVRPDGTILPNDAPPAAALPPVAPPAERAPPVAKTSTPRSTATPKTTSRIAPKPIKLAKADTAQTNVADDADAAPAPKPTKKPHRERVAVAEPTTGDAAETTASVPSAGGGGFAVQLAAPGSEADARSASSKFAKKFAEALGGRRLGFHKAQANGKSVYRVRVGSLSKDEAVALCGKLKADGGSCFVAKN